MSLFNVEIPVVERNFTINVKGRSFHFSYNNYRTVYVSMMSKGKKYDGFILTFSPDNSYSYVGGRLDRRNGTWINLTMPYTRSFVEVDGKRRIQKTFTYPELMDYKGQLEGLMSFAYVYATIGKAKLIATAEYGHVFSL